MENLVLKNGRKALKSKCDKCDSNKMRMLRSNNDVSMGSGLVNDLINKLPFEAHLIDQADDGSIKRHSFTGPGTKLDKRLDKNNNTVKGSEPINALDRGAMQHDICYRDNKDTKTRLSKCDPPLQAVAQQILNDSNATKIQKANALITKKAMQVKRLLKQ
jgi:hypothetical protein